MDKFPAPMELPVQLERNRQNKPTVMPDTVSVLKKSGEGKSRGERGCVVSNRVVGMATWSRGYRAENGGQALVIWAGHWGRRGDWM